MGLTQRALKNVLDGAILTGTGLAVNFPAKLLLFCTVIAELVLVGLALVILRWFFFLTLPTLIQFCVPLTALIDFFMTFIVIFIDAAIAVVDVIIALIEAFTGHATNNMVHFVGFTLFTVDQVRDELIYILDTCEPYNDAYTVIGNAIQQAAHVPVCSATRFVYPVQWLYNPVNNMMGWMFAGSAIPDSACGTAISNCNAPLPSGAISGICVGIGAGYIILELILPIFILILLHSAIGHGVWWLLLGLGQLVIDILDKGMKIFDNIIEKAGL